MLDGKMLRGETGTPMRRMDLANSSLADAEPEPLTLANLTTKSLVASMGFTGASISLSFPRKRESSDFAKQQKQRRWIPGSAAMKSRRPRNDEQKHESAISCRHLFGFALAFARVGFQQQELAHVPGAGGAAFRA